MTNVTKKHTERFCLGCDEDLPERGLVLNYCTRACAQRDAERWERDRRDDMARYFEV